MEEEDILEERPEAHRSAERQEGERLGEDRMGENRMGEDRMGDDMFRERLEHRYEVPRDEEKPGPLDVGT